MENNENIIQVDNNSEINFIDLFKILWRNRKFIIKMTLAFALIGVITAISTPNVYTASCTMVPQTGQKGSNINLGGLAAMAGINLGSLNTGEVLSPSVYPKIMKNVDFQKELIYSKFHFNGLTEPVSIYEYYTDDKYHKFNLSEFLKKYTIGLPGVILSAVKGEKNSIANNDTSHIKSFSLNEKKVLKVINKSLSLSVNNKEGYVSITASMNEPLLAAELAQRGQELLQKYITEFKIDKVESNLKFVDINYEESKKNFEKKQEELAKYRDANKNFTSSLAKTYEEKLNSEYTLLLSIYTELAKQKEQAKIAVTENTPIFTVIEPVYIPTEKSKPNRTMTFITFIFLGFVISISVIIAIPHIEENFIPNLKKYWFVPNIV